MSVTGLILAAGDSSRLGQPKQLLPIGQLNLLQHVEQQLHSLCDSLWVVVGYQQATMTRQLHFARAIHNPDWSNGMGHSLKFGCQHLQATDALLIALCDQPHIPKAHYQALINASTEHPQHIICSHYDGHCGVPALFPKCFHPDLLGIGDLQGAHQVIEQHPDQHISISCPAAAADIDTPEHYQQMRKDPEKS